MKKKRKKIAIKLFFSLIFLVTIICYSILGYWVLKANIIPNKYVIEGIIIAIVFLACSLFVIFTNSKNIFKILVVFLMLLSSGFSCIGSYYLSHTYNFIRIMNKKEDVIAYSVITLNNNEYERINDIKEKNIAYLNDNKAEIKDKLDRKIEFEEMVVNNAPNLVDKLLNNEVSAVVLEESYLTLLNDELKDFKNQTKVIYNFEIDAKSYKENTKKLDMTQDSFILYISGIDPYGNINTSRGRSDLNILAVVNPKTNHILVVYHPNNYYLSFMDQDGLKDKLSNMGIYGIDKSIKALEKLYDIDINHYFKVNFNDLVQVIDIIGGIDIEANENYEIAANIMINEGKNHLNGQEALNFARYGKVFKTKDNMRVESQQQVINAILNKLTTEEILIKDYNNILNNLEGSFETDIETEMITSLIKNQLTNGATWYADGIMVEGKSKKEYIYSLGKTNKIDVMVPDNDSVNRAKERINSVFSETKKRT